MLVCNVSLRPPRSGIAAITAEIAEAAAAADAAQTGNVVFATLVDDPASVRDRVDAYLGEIMLEAASADAVASAGSVFAVAVIEAVTAADLLDGSVTGAAAAQSAMLPLVFVNSDGTPRQANASGIMVNL